MKRFIIGCSALLTLSSSFAHAADWRTDQQAAFQFMNASATNMMAYMAKRDLGDREGACESASNAVSNAGKAYQKGVLVVSGLEADSSLGSGEKEDRLKRARKQVSGLKQLQEQAEIVRKGTCAAA